VGILSHQDVLAAMEASTDTEALLASPLASLMSRELVRIGGNQNVGDAAMLLTQQRVHQVVVEQEDEEPSLLGTSEILQAVRDQQLQARLSEIMTTVVFSIDGKETVASARRYLKQAALSGLIVHDGKWPIGIFGQAEALASLATEQTNPVDEAMCARIICLPVDMPVSRAAQQAKALGARHIIVQDGGDTVGLATATDFAGLLASIKP
jgi:predicted transcriptional regulator